MIPVQEIRAHARENAVPESTIEQDYTQNWNLKSLYDVYPDIIFKGGTGIRKVHIPNYRFSDDLDFGLTKQWKRQDLLELLNRVIESAREESGIAFESPVGIIENVNGFEGAVYLRLLRRSGSPLKIKLDITKFENEITAFPLESVPLIHPYSDRCNCILNVYSLKETLAEKVRSVFERTRPRDLYDIHHLMVKVESDELGTGILTKCEFKNIHPNLEDVLSRKEYFRSSWETSLGHQLHDLPEFESTFQNIVTFIKLKLEY